jgi:hypothetical protein
VKPCDDLHEFSDELMLLFQQLGVECVRTTGANPMRHAAKAGGTRCHLADDTR